MARFNVWYIPTARRNISPCVGSPWCEILFFTKWDRLTGVTCEDMLMVCGGSTSEVMEGCVVCRGGSDVCAIHTHVFSEWWTEFLSMQER